MVFSAFQFVITTLLVMVCARALGLSEGDVPFITFVIPALWILPRGGITGFVLLAGDGRVRNYASLSASLALGQYVGTVPDDDGSVFTRQQ